ncbi:hypothetical protein NQ317_019655 [Molorchus minor]|uniref:Uncharacterized protein n=1 Tax=Molorchus minor TaxID=1323400 RepID=A0ABQ9IX53_9CUCU|nr:hypothetical protein NQ317_019655 [Molorchus minor]
MAGNSKPSEVVTRKLIKVLGSDALTTSGGFQLSNSLIHLPDLVTKTQIFIQMCLVCEICFMALEDIFQKTRYKHEVLVDNEPVLYEILDTSPKSVTHNLSVGVGKHTTFIYCTNNKNKVNYKESRITLNEKNIKKEKNTYLREKGEIKSEKKLRFYEVLFGCAWVQKGPAFQKALAAALPLESRTPVKKMPKNHEMLEFEGLITGADETEADIQMVLNPGNKASEDPYRRAFA